MRRTPGTSLSAFVAAIGMAVLLAIVAAPDAVAETVRFPVATTPPTPLQERLARERGQPIAAPSPAVELTGELYRPAGAGRFPGRGVVAWMCGPAVSRGRGCCRRRLCRSRLCAAGRRQLRPTRRHARAALPESGAPADRIMDAYGALIYLAGLPFIDPDRIAVVGYSQGADTALGAVKLGGIETQFDRKFRAAIAYFPYCVASYGAVSVPAVILIGDLDEATPARACRDMMAGRSGECAAAARGLSRRASRVHQCPPARQTGNDLRLPQRIQRGRGQGGLGRRACRLARGLRALRTVQSAASASQPAKRTAQESAGILFDGRAVRHQHRLGGPGEDAFEGVARGAAADEGDAKLARHRRARGRP